MGSELRFEYTDGHNKDFIFPCHALDNFLNQLAGREKNIGRHSLLITPEFGSMVWLGAVLTQIELEPDDMQESICNNCNLCVEACPVNALEDREINQQSCWNHAFGDNEKTKNWEISCHKCRDICPYNLGSENFVKTL